MGQVRPVIWRARLPDPAEGAKSAPFAWSLLSPNGFLERRAAEDEEAVGAEVHVCLALKTKCVAILQAQAALRPEGRMADFMLLDVDVDANEQRRLPSSLVHVGCRPLAVVLLLAVSVAAIIAPWPAIASAYSE